MPADGPVQEDAAKLATFGQFVGSWDIQGIWYLPDGSCRTGKGEWHFDWILGGTGIQDVLFASGAPPSQFGSTFRCYDKAIDAWHLSWMQPASGEFVNLIGRQIGDRVVCESADSQPQRRWSFTEITPHAFRWLGEVSHDNGASWFLEQEMGAVRRLGP
ncbi:MAG TPA: hypothetical protein VJK02_20555 [Anaerolineales bacterium]|nr:hypothetical protein [Anaerolineales bacterium]HLE04369.1 hypothetical protein [Anaerolineales bacterium]